MTAYKFIDGVAIANQIDAKTGNLFWGLIDTDGNHIGEFKYSFVEPWGDGYYRCEKGNKKNILRKDGTEVLSVWFNSIEPICCGLFIIGNTIRKTKEHPTLYPMGLACVNGDILFPPIFDRLGWHDSVKLDFFYAEKNGKPYIITKSGFIIDPLGGHLPKLSDDVDLFEWRGPKGTVCHGCVFSDGINEKGEGCACLAKEDFRNAVLRGQCDEYKDDMRKLSVREERELYNLKKANEKTLKETDEYALALVKDFIKDKLDGDVMRLISFNFRDLKDDEKYGDCRGFAFTPERTNIMKAIMTIAFKTPWHNINHYGFDHYEYEITMLNPYSMLLGVPLEERKFKVLYNYRPSAELLDRAWAFYLQCHTIGNYVPTIAGLFSVRKDLRKNQRYTDSFLHHLYLAFCKDKKADKSLMGCIYNLRKKLGDYQGTEGFAEICNGLLLSAYLDDAGKPKSLFAGVYCDDKALTRERYFEAIDEYISFCHKVIDNRTDGIIVRLMEALDMKQTYLEEERVMSLKVCEHYTLVPPIPDDPKDSISYTDETTQALCFVQLFPVKKDKIYPFDNNQFIIDDIHASIEDNEGLIEVSNGCTQYGKEYVYTITKQLKERGGVTYFLTMHLHKGNNYLYVMGMFEERGVTGIRDATVYEYALREGIIEEMGGDGWMKDPYDDNFNQGVLMNLSEQRKYDRSFPDHPLTQLRNLISYILQNN